MGKTQAGYRRALKLLSAFFDHPPAAGSALEAEFELLMMMVERYEAQHITVKAPDPVVAIEFDIEQRGLHDKLLMPAEVLIQANTIGCAA
jgi:HTH-type transcriptional regulator / antitoxin HigA